MNYLIVTVYTALAVCLPSMCFTQTWIARYDGPGNGYDAATAIAVDDASNVYVTGYSASSGINFDYATIKYAPTGIQEDSGSKIHDVRYSLMISPNPFHDRTDIRYQITDTSRNVDLIIYDVTGRIVKSFRIIPSGRRGLSSQGDGVPYSATQYGGLRNTLSWDGTDNAGRKLPSGIYFVTCRSGNNRETKKLILIR